ncbi:MAG TPA: TSUP family transporter [Bacteroidales bacterium]|nr:TSUP family transporter [Bacteroidales bacterium]
MEFSIFTIVLLCLAFFVAGFIDSIAGGGGLITLPSLLFAGIPPQFALGTNKLASTFGTGTAVFNFVRSKKVNWKVIAFGIAFSLGGSFIGSQTVMIFNQEIVGKIIVFMLPLGVVAVLIPRKGIISGIELTRKDLLLKIPLICLIIGFYDGFFGPGTGSFLTLSFFFFTRMKLIDATANAKVFNLMSNVGGLTAFILGSKVLFLLAIPIAVANMAGNFLGSRLAIKRGEGVIRVFLIFAFVMLLVSLVWKYYF